jgi:hypothetical protein
MKTNDQVAHVECSLQSDSATGAACGAYYGRINLGVQLADLDVRLGSNPFVPIASNQQIFRVENVDLTIYVEGAAIEVHAKSGQAPAGTTIPLVIGAYPLVTGGPKFLVPVKIDFDGATCPSVFQSTTCTNVNIATDSMLRCASPIP